MLLLWSVGCSTFFRVFTRRCLQTAVLLVRERGFMLWGWASEASGLTDGVLAEVDLAGGSVGSDSRCPLFLLLCSWDRAPPPTLMLGQSSRSFVGVPCG